MTNLERARDLYDLILGGKLMDGFEKYYHEDVVMTEVGDEPRNGKTYNREHEQKFLESIEGFHGAEVEAITASEDGATTMVENWMDVTIKGAGRMKFVQVAVQRWQDGQIIEERFYHK